MGCQEAAEQVQGSRPWTRLETACPAVGGHEVQAGLGSQKPVDAQLPAKMGQVGAATHADMLAGVYKLAAGWILKGTGAPSESIPRFEECHAKAARRQRRRRRQPSQTTPYY
jgi:hypothetical protein